MDLGYSILLREYVTATEVDYGDCKLFQITCPICHEAIFKAGKYGQDRQYFSHYAASKADVSTCELRVRGLKPDDLVISNLTGHGQTMEQFFAHFREFIVAWLFVENTGRIRRQINWMVARPAFIRIAQVFRSFLIQSNQNTNYKLSRDELKRIFAGDRSPYWIEQQERFAEDFQQHLLAPNSQSALCFVVAIMIFANITILPQESWRLLTEGHDRQLKQHLQKFYTGENLINFEILLTATLDMLLMTVPYFDLLNGKPGDPTNRKLFFQQMVDVVALVRHKIKMD
jgi:hypothetical protein